MIGVVVIQDDKGNVTGAHIIVDKEKPILMESQSYIRFENEEQVNKFMAIIKVGQEIEKRNKRRKE